MLIISGSSLDGVAADDAEGSIALDQVIQKWKTKFTIQESR
jgi:hypothetical protein